MKVTLLDIVTGEVRDSIRTELPPSVWIDGNWSCDCNREIEFGNNSDLEVSICLGSRRYIVIKHDAEGYSIDEFNDDYPLSLQLLAREYWNLTAEQIIAYRQIYLENEYANAN